MLSYHENRLNIAVSVLPVKVLAFQVSDILITLCAILT